MRDTSSQISEDEAENMFEDEDEIYNVSGHRNLEEELEILSDAYHNAYLIVTKRITVPELLAADEEMVFLPFDPEVPETLMIIIDDVIDYFSKEEEYEKCAELLRVKNRLDDI